MAPYSLVYSAFKPMIIFESCQWTWGPENKPHEEETHSNKCSHIQLHSHIKYITDTIILTNSFAHTFITYLHMLLHFHINMLTHMYMMVHSHRPIHLHLFTHGHTRIFTGTKYSYTYTLTNHSHIKKFTHEKFTHSQK